LVLGIDDSLDGGELACFFGFSHFLLFIKMKQTASANNLTAHFNATYPSQFSAHSTPTHNSSTADIHAQKVASSGISLAKATNVLKTKVATLKTDMMQMRYKSHISGDK
jgi:hypothetical protein